MPGDKLIDTESENKGPAILDRNPVVLPKQRKKAADKIKDWMDN